MVPLRDLQDDYYDFDERNFCLVGRRRHHKYQLGDPIHIQIAKANLEKKQLDFTITDNKSDKTIDGSPAKTIDEKTENHHSSKSAHNRYKKGKEKGGNSKTGKKKNKSFKKNTKRNEK